MKTQASSTPLDLTVGESRTVVTPDGFWRRADNVTRILPIEDAKMAKRHEVIHKRRTSPGGLPMFVDGKRICRGIRFGTVTSIIYEFLPGTHVIDLYSGWKSFTPWTITGEAGKTYMIEDRVSVTRSYMLLRVVWNDMPDESLSFMEISKPTREKVICDVTKCDGPPTEDADGYKRVYPFPTTAKEEKVAARFRASLTASESLKLSPAEPEPKDVLMKLLSADSLPIFARPRKRNQRL